MGKQYDVNKETGELKIFTENGYFLITPNKEGLSIELFDKTILEGFVEEEHGIPGINLVDIELIENKCVSYFWRDSQNPLSSEKIEHKIKFKN